MESYAFYVACEVPAGRVDFLQSIAFRFVLRGYPTRACHQAAHSTFQNSLQSITSRGFMMSFVSMEDFRCTPHVAGNIQNVENIYRQLR